MQIIAFIHSKIARINFLMRAIFIHLRSSRLMVT